MFAISRGIGRSGISASTVPCTPLTRRSTTFPTTNANTATSQDVASSATRRLREAVAHGSSSPKVPTQTNITKSATDVVDIAAMTKRLGVRLSKDELKLLRQKLDANADGAITKDEIRLAGWKALEDRWTREISLSVICKPTNKLDHIGEKVHTLLDYGGTALFAVVGTQVAGDQGMNIVGCALVGCVAAMGGGTLNNLLYGISSPLLGKQGVFWVKDPRKLMLSLAASVFTFFAWPEYCRWQAQRELRDVIGENNLEADGSVGQAAFVAACNRDAEFLANVQVGLGVGEDQDDPSELFKMVDSDGSGDIDLHEMQTLVGKRFDGSPTVYALDTAAFSALSIVGVRHAVSQGLHPFVAATSGITICFGGILRDVLCGRDLAVGGQSYAFATGAGSGMYIFLRELHVRSILSIPTFFRLSISAGLVAVLRTWEFVRGEPLLEAMHGNVGRR